MSIIKLIFCKQLSIDRNTRTTELEFIDIFSNCSSGQPDYWPYTVVNDLVCFEGLVVDINCELFSKPPPLKATARYLLRYNDSQWAPIVVVYTDWQNTQNGNYIDTLRTGTVMDGPYNMIGAPVVYKARYNGKWFDQQCHKRSGVTKLNYPVTTIQIGNIKCLAKYMVIKFKPGLVSAKLINKQ
ncbi:uncharacterized protein LOC128956448 [Oppia nitens]|uniref:uncharacterized protein LOC128956448 n=1 Tax=Oppia nitens TaxID=1686743 RepID=UPI0023DBDE33|nr:uncharacterized protein LOC128956448 [Oppia nitens]